MNETEIDERVAALDADGLQDLNAGLAALHRQGLLSGHLEEVWEHLAADVEEEDIILRRYTETVEKNRDDLQGHWDGPEVEPGRYLLYEDGRYGDWVTTDDDLDRLLAGHVAQEDAECWLGGQSWVLDLLTGRSGDIDLKPRVAWNDEVTS